MDFPYRKILIIASNHVGNNVFCTPGIRFLKKHIPDAEIDVVTLNRRSFDVFVANPDINTIKVIKRKQSLKRIIANYEYVIALHPDKALPYLQNLPIPWVIIPPWSGQRHRANDVLEFMQSLIGNKIEREDRCYALHTSPQHITEMAQLLKNTEKNFLIGLHLGIGRTAVHGWKFWYSKRAQDPRLWPIENYIALAKQLSQFDSQIKFVITGTNNERFLGKQFSKKISNVINVIGKTSLPGFNALMKRFQLFISPDTGALHVAANNLDLPLIALFGPSNPELTGPYPLREHHHIIKKSSCAEIHPEEVYKIALQYIEKSKIK